MLRCHRPSGGEDGNQFRLVASCYSIKRSQPLKPVNQRQSDAAAMTMGQTVAEGVSHLETTRQTALLNTDNPTAHKSNRVSTDAQVFYLFTTGKFMNVKVKALLAIVAVSASSFALAQNKNFTGFSAGVNVNLTEIVH